MNAIIYPIMPSITKFEGLIISFNNTLENIQSSLKELQLNYRRDIAEKLKVESTNTDQVYQTLPVFQRELIQFQNMELMEVDIKQSHQILSYQIDSNLNNKSSYYDNESILRQQQGILTENNLSPKTTPKFDDLKYDMKFQLNDFEPPCQYISQTKTSKKKKISSSKENCFFSFKKESIKGNKKNISENLSQRNNEFYVSLPSQMKCFLTSFHSLGFKNFEGKKVSDLLIALNYQPNTISQVLYYNKETKLSRNLNFEEKLNYLELTQLIEIQIILQDDNIVNEIIKYDYGELEIKVIKKKQFKKELCFFYQDCVEIHKDLLDLVEKITFYNFGQSNKKAQQLKEHDFENFTKWVINWCAQNNFEILYIGNNLIVRLI